MAARKPGGRGGKPGTILRVQVTPRASKNSVIKVLENGMVKIHLTAPPVEGKANTSLKKFLARILDIPVSHINILVGESGRFKSISVMNMDAATIKNKIQDQIAKI